MIQLNGSQPRHKENCQIHNSKLEYYCMNCKKPICADCAVIETTHKSHNFEKIDKIYKLHFNKIKVEQQRLKKKLGSLHNQMDSIEDIIDQLTLSKEVKIKEIQSAVEKCNSRLQDELKQSLVILFEEKKSLSEEIQFFEECCEDIQAKVKSASKSSLIIKSKEFVKIIQEMNQKENRNFDIDTIRKEFISDFVPNYISGSFQMHNYTELRINSDIVYSESLISGGIKWRLKVYPNGNGASEGQYLSVFLEMVEGPQCVQTYEYKIEMMHTLNHRQSIMRDFVSEFEPGECWGYNRFYKIEDLETEGYLDPENDTVSPFHLLFIYVSLQIILKFYVRTPTYRHLLDDKDKQIKILQEESKKKDKIVYFANILKNFFKIDFFKSQVQSLRIQKEESLDAQMIEEQIRLHLEQESQESEEPEKEFNIIENASDSEAFIEEQKEEEPGNPTNVKKLKYQVKGGFPTGPESENKRKFAAHMLKYSETFMKKMKVLKETTANNINRKKQLCFPRKTVKSMVINQNVVEKQEKKESESELNENQ